MALRFPTWARFESSGSGTQSERAISSISNRDHDYLFELPWFGERSAQSLRRRLVSAMVISELPRVSTWADSPRKLMK
jgi:hypothetical protein